ncbi:MAG TPA: hypothetical protein VK837_14240 [Longimicrobiales bacterium]|nr:hypothetical protein [Longimicrobiales bacterium]
MSGARVQGVEGGGRGVGRLIFAAVRRRLGRVPEPVRILARRPPMLRGHIFMEASQESTGLVPASIKKLAQVRVATRIGCPF